MKKCFWKRTTASDLISFDDWKKSQSIYFTHFWFFFMISNACIFFHRTSNKVFETILELKSIIFLCKWVKWGPYVRSKILNLMSHRFCQGPFSSTWTTAYHGFYIRSLNQTHPVSVPWNYSKVWGIFMEDSRNTCQYSSCRCRADEINESTQVKQIMSFSIENPKSLLPCKNLSWICGRRKEARDHKINANFALWSRFGHRLWLLCDG